MQAQTTFDFLDRWKNYGGNTNLPRFFDRQKSYATTFIVRKIEPVTK
jgi:hypothetical protein